MKKTLAEEAEAFGLKLHERNAEELKKLAGVLLAKAIVDIALAPPEEREAMLAACKREHLEKLWARAEELKVQSLAELDAWFRGERMN